MLFTGPEGVGKEYTAIDFARKLCCSLDTPCSLSGELCEDCRKAARLEHPGIHLVYPTPSRGSGEKEEDDVADLSKILQEKRQDIFATFRFSRKVSIRIARARAIIKRAHTKPFGSPYNIFIIVDAHTAREEVQNALLKLVEEPPEQSILIWITENVESILYTIRSRCQRLRFSPLKKGVVERILRDYYGLDPQVSSRAADLSQGSIKRAKEFAASIDDTARGNVVEFAGRILDAPESWLVERALDLSRGGNRDEVALFLQELALYFRDIMCGDEALCFNVESRESLRDQQDRWPRKSLPKIVEKIIASRDAILRRNANIDSALAHLFLDIRQSR